MVTDQEIGTRYGIILILVLVLLLVAPVMYLVIAYMQLRNPGFQSHPRDLLFYLFLLYAIGQAALIPFIEKKLIAVHMAKRLAGKALLEAGQTIVICKLAFINSIYVYGLTIFFITGSINKLPYFYVVGILCTFLFWPSKSRFTELVRKLEAK
jgi:hypothetical protein